MTYSATVARVLVASPSDVLEEREIVRDAISDWNDAHSQSKSIILQPVGWEHSTFPSYGKHPQKLISKQIVAKSDALIGVFWSRIGTPTEDSYSGSVDEILEMHEAGKPILLFFSNREISPKNIHAEQLQHLRLFKSSIQKSAFYHEFDSKEDLAKKVTKALGLFMNSHDGAWQNDTKIAWKMLSSHERTLINHARMHSNGQIAVRHHVGRTTILVGNVEFGGGGRRFYKPWKDALDNLRLQNILANSVSGQFLFTDYGWQIALASPD
jgi:hypothetical protein